MLSLYSRRTFLALLFMMVSPSVTWPSPASATRPSLRTSSTVVLRMRGCSDDIFGKGHYRKSFERKSSKQLTGQSVWLLMSDKLEQALNKWSTPWSAAARRRFGPRRLVACLNQLNRRGRDRLRPTTALPGQRTPKSCRIHLIRGSFSLSRRYNKLKLIGHQADPAPLTARTRSKILSQF